MNHKKLILCLLSLFLPLYLFAQAEYYSDLIPTPQLTPEQIAKHPTDKWFTAERPDYSELDERIKTLAKNEETPEAVAKIICEGLNTDIEKARAIFDWLAYNVAYDTSYKVHSAAEDGTFLGSGLAVFLVDEEGLVYLKELLFQQSLKHLRPPNPLSLPQARGTRSRARSLP